jgi:DNA-binding transcriptional regulator YhcF (GntR family)
MVIKITLENEERETSFSLKNCESWSDELEKFIEHFITGLTNLGYSKKTIYEMLNSFVEDYETIEK